MCRSRFTEEQGGVIPNEQDAETGATARCGAHAFSEQTLSRWKQRGSVLGSV